MKLSTILAASVIANLLLAEAESQNVAALGDPFPAVAADVGITFDDTAKITPTLHVFDVLPGTVDKMRKRILLEWFGLGESDRARMPESYRHEPGAEYYFDESSRSYCLTVPNRGYLAAEKLPSLSGPRIVPDGVPDEIEVRSKALDCLKALFYEQSAFAHEQDGALSSTKSMNSRTHFDRLKNGPVTDVTGRGIWFWRSEAGTKSFGLGGGGGVRFAFGNHGALNEVQIVLRLLKPRETIRFDSVRDVKSAFREGRCFSDTVGRPEIKSEIRVISVTPYLLELSGTEPQQVVWPIVEAKCSTETNDGAKPFRVLFAPHRNEKPAHPSQKRKATAK